MDLNALWFLLITVLFAGFFFLEGFDYGVGTLLPFVGKNDTERRITINAVGPFWDGNEVWLLTAGGAIFAAFPHWYATLFSGYYLALFLILVALIMRGVAFEFRSKVDRPEWRRFWDRMIFLGSALPALLWGVALTSIARGVPINAGMQYVGSFWDLLSPYTLVGGLATLSLFAFHGALFLALKTEDHMVERAGRAASLAAAAAVPSLLLLVVLSYSQTDLLAKPGPAFAFWAAAAALVLAAWLVRGRKFAQAFIANGLAIVLSIAAIFGGLFPRVMVSSLNPEWSLTVYNASSSPYTLKVMTIVALTLVPVVLAYQAWTYWVFRRRVTAKNLEY